jgi:L-2-hydroxyglutarate oxidase LhgO
LCFRGYELGLSFLENNKIPYDICGKIITTGKVSTTKEKDEREVELEKLYINGKNLGISNMELQKNPYKRWNHVLGSLALWIPKTGIVDVPHYLKSIWRICEEKGVKFLKNKTVLVKDKVVYYKDNQTNTLEEINADLYINAGGLFADELTNQLDLPGYEIRPNKGEYFRLKKTLPFNSLVYPLPMHDSTALGVHYTYNLGGDAYAGPNSNWAASKFDYKIQTDSSIYLKSLQQILDFYSEDDITEGYVGLRPRLFFNGEPIKDFVIKKALNWIHLLGIESPGLTSAPAIAEEVLKII